MSAPVGHKGHQMPPPNYGQGSQPSYGFNPPQYVPGPGHPPVTVIQTPAILPLGPEPAHVMCPSCRAAITTRVDHETTTKTHLISVIMCIFMLWPCCLIPYCMDSCKNTNHYCPSCGAFLGEYKR